MNFSDKVHPEEMRLRGDFLYTESDKTYMRHALDLSKQGIGRVNPNPLVGAVAVKDHRIIGEGYHSVFGEAHAEVNALSHCLEDPRGATLYVTLEPCSHQGKTPPCADLLISKGISRVVVAMGDPNPLVSGKGIRKLRDAGISVSVGLMEEEACRLNEVFIKYITTEKPFVLYKAAVSFDGKTACHTGESQWITSESSREDARRLRNIYKGIMVGAGTILHDNPKLTTRIPNGRDPIRIIVDGKLSVPLTAQVFHEYGQNIVITTSQSDREKKEALLSMGVDILIADSKKSREVDLSLAMEALAKKGIDGVLLEGGSTLAEAALRSQIIDKIRLYMAPLIIGGTWSPSMIGGIGIPRLSEAYHLKNLHTDFCGSDLMIEGYLQY